MTCDLLDQHPKTKIHTDSKNTPYGVSSAETIVVFSLTSYFFNRIKKCFKSMTVEIQRKA